MAISDIERPPESRSLVDDKASNDSYHTIDKAAAASAELEDEFVSKAPNSRAYFLDATRIVCVALVCVDHGAPAYSQWNTLYVQNWGLQMIFLTCGASLGLSKGGYAYYVTRLSIYVALGVLCNWIAWIATGQDWMHDPWNVVFQMWFVVGLIGYSSLLWPVKAYFKRLNEIGREQSEDSTSTVVGVTLIFAGCLGITGVSLFLQNMVDKLPIMAASTPQKGAMTGFAYWFGGADGGDNMKSVVKSLALSFRSMWAVLIAATWLPQWQSCLSWFLVLHMYGCRVASWYPAPGDRLCHGLDLMLLGLTCYAFGLHKRQRLADVLGRYWFMPFIFCGLVWKPGASVRYDSKPPEAFGMRWRMEVIELVIITMWLISADRWFDARIFTEDRLNFMNNWALCAFMAHKAVHIVAPYPLNWCFLLGLVPGFWFIEEKVRPWCRSASSSDQKQSPLPAPPESS